MRGAERHNYRADGNTAYVGNARREDMIKMAEKWLARAKAERS